MLSRNRQTDFSRVAHIKSPRSTFNRLSEVLTTINKGDLVPFYNDIDVLPADTKSLTTSFVIRTVAPLTRPVMGVNLKLDYWYFFVPYTQLWNIDHCKTLFGDATDAAWIATQEYEVPQLEFKTSLFGTATSSELDNDGYMRMKNGTNNLSIKDFVTKYSNSVERYLFMPTIVTKQDTDGMLCKAFTNNNTNYGFSQKDISVAAWTLRGYHRIYNFFFRREDLIAPVTLDTSDSTKIYSSINDFTPCYKVSRYKDYMGANLPQPQKAVAGDVTLPLGTLAQVITTNKKSNTPMAPLELINANTGETITSGISGALLGVEPNSNKVISFGVQANYQPGPTNIAFGNLYADLANATAATVNSLRMAVATQRLYEKFAMYGSRMEETILGQFEVNCPELALQIPEYLGGYSVPITFSEVTNNSSDLGEVGAKSCTTHLKHDVTKSFTQWGVIIGLCAIRQNHLYSNGIERGYFRKRIFDFFWPTFNNLGNQPTYNREIFAFNRADEAFGYMEAWSEYRYKPSRISGQIMDFADFKAYTMADMYEDCPYLGQEWIEEDNKSFRYAMGIAEDNPINDFILDIAVLDQSTRPMTLNSIPGLMDHM